LTSLLLYSVQCWLLVLPFLPKALPLKRTPLTPLCQVLSEERPD